MSEKHTPGPWECQYRETHNNPIIKGNWHITTTSPDTCKDRKSIRQIVALPDWYQAKEDTRGVYEANARLITAAPDLLAAMEQLANRLESAVDEMDCLRDQGDIEKSPQDQAAEDADRNAIEIARAALAKAVKP